MPAEKSAAPFYWDDDLESKARYMTDVMKTHDLIKLLAQNGEDWTQEHIELAIRETGALPFSLSDVAYMRAVLNDDLCEKERVVIEKGFDEMKNLDPDKRHDYYHTQLYPHINVRAARCEEIRLRFDGLVYHSTPYYVKED